MTPDLVLAWVALINAFGGVVALIIHALRVPYRESNAAEAVHVQDAATRSIAAANGPDHSHWGQNRPPVPGPSPMPVERVQDQDPG
jgi:hypothetical protein